MCGGILMISILIIRSHVNYSMFYYFHLGCWSSSLTHVDFHFSVLLSGMERNLWYESVLHLPSFWPLSQIYGWTKVYEFCSVWSRAMMAELLPVLLMSLAEVQAMDINIVIVRWKGCEKAWWRCNVRNFILLPKVRTRHNNCDLVRIIKVVLTINTSLRLHFQTYKLCTEFDNKLDEVCSCVE